MAQLTYAQLRGEIGAWLDLDVSSGSEGETTVKRCLNWAGRNIWTSKPWYERRAQAILLTIAPYITGTVDVTNGSPTITGAGTVWTGFSGRKFSLGLGSPWYRITNVGGVGTATIESNYAEATATAKTYTIFQDEFDIGTDVDSIHDASLLREEFGGQMKGLSEAGLDQSAYVHSQNARPSHYALTNSQTAGSRRLRIWPIPDDAYRIRVRYWKSFTDMSADGDLCVLGANKELLLLTNACLLVQNIVDVRQVTSYPAVQAMIEETWKTQLDRVPLTYNRRGFDDYRADAAFWFDTTNAFS